MAQGWLTPDYLQMAGLDARRLYSPETMADDARPGFHSGRHDINLLKGGIVYADKVTTVRNTQTRVTGWGSVDDI